MILFVLTTVKLLTSIYYLKDRDWKRSSRVETLRVTGSVEVKLQEGPNTRLFCVGEGMKGFLYLALGTQFHWEASQFKYIWETSRATQPGRLITEHFVTSCAF